MYLYSGQGVALASYSCPDPSSPPPADGGAPSEDERILISEVEVVGVEGELRDWARAALQTKPNFAYTLGEVQRDVRRVYDLGYFAQCEVRPEDTRDGVKITFVVTPNQELRGVVCVGE